MPRVRDKRCPICDKMAHIVNFNMRGYDPRLVKYRCPLLHEFYVLVKQKEYDDLWTLRETKKLVLEAVNGDKES